MNLHGSGGLCVVDCSQSLDGLFLSHHPLHLRLCLLRESFILSPVAPPASTVSAFSPLSECPLCCFLAFPSLGLQHFNFLLTYPCPGQACSSRVSWHSRGQSHLHSVPWSPLALSPLSRPGLCCWLIANFSTRSSLTTTVSCWWVFSPGFFALNCLL